MTNPGPHPENPSAFANGRRKPPADDELLTVDDVCAWFQVTRDWVYDEVEAGRLPFLRLGRKNLRFDRNELVGYLKAATGRRSSPQRLLAQPGWTAGLEPLD
jgi:excisionase family DNA binding protein